MPNSRFRRKTRKASLNISGIRNEFVTVSCSANYRELNPVQLRHTAPWIFNPVSTSDASVVSQLEAPSGSSLSQINDSLRFIRSVCLRVRLHDSRPSERLAVNSWPDHRLFIKIPSNNNNNKIQSEMCQNINCTWIIAQFLWIPSQPARGSPDVSLWFLNCFHALHSERWK